MLYSLNIRFFDLANRQFQGNPKYKAQEDYYDDIQEFKKVFIDFSH